MPLLLRVTFVSLAVVGVTAAPVKVPLPKREHPLVRPVCGALASCTAEACTMPIDVAKVRMSCMPHD